MSHFIYLSVSLAFSDFPIVPWLPVLGLVSSHRKACYTLTLSTNIAAGINNHTISLQVTKKQALQSISSSVLILKTDCLRYHLIWVWANSIVPFGDFIRDDQMNPLLPVLSRDPQTTLIMKQDHHLDPRSIPQTAWLINRGVLFDLPAIELTADRFKTKN